MRTEAWTNTHQVNINIIGNTFKLISRKRILLNCIPYRKPIYLLGRVSN